MIRAGAVALVLIALLCGPALADGHHNPPGDRLAAQLETCPTLTACFRVFDRAPWEATGYADETQARRMAQGLARFGHPAKAALMARAATAEDQDGVDRVLEAFPGWSDDDVPALSTLLWNRQNVAAADILAGLDTPAAIAVLLEDIRRHGVAITAFTVSQAGDKWVDRLMPLLTDPEPKSIAGAQEALMRLVVGPNSRTEAWRATALDRTAAIEARRQALRALAAQVDRLTAWGPSLRPLLADASPVIRAEAERTLAAWDDPAGAVAMARGCKPSASPFGELGQGCIGRLAKFKDSADQTGPYLMAFFDAPDGNEVAEAITSLALLDYQPARSRMEAALASDDWLVVFSAARGLGWLGDTQAIDALRQVARDHWLPRVRVMAALSADELASQGRLTSMPALPRRAWTPSHGFNTLTPDAYWPEIDTPACKPARWQWRGERLGEVAMTQKVVMPGGRLTGRDRGEWGGELTWTPEEGPPVVLAPMNVRGMVRDGDGVWVLLGLAHLVFNEGFVLHVTFDARGQPMVSRPYWFPSQGGGLLKGRNGAYASNTFDGVVVFTAQGIQGMAQCEAR